MVEAEEETWKPLVDPEQQEEATVQDVGVLTRAGKGGAEEGSQTGAGQRVRSESLYSLCML